MLLKIDDNYIDEAIRIRKTYIDCLKIIVSKEDEIQICKTKVEDILNKAKTVKLDTEKVSSILESVEENIKKIYDTLKPYYDKIEDLKQDSQKLYGILSHRYPGYSAQDFEDYIKPYILANE
jgi:chromosome segregation ATPase